MTKSPDGTTTSSGQSAQSLKISPGSGLVALCALPSGAGRCCATGGAGGAWAGAPGEGRGSTVRPRCALACGPAAAQSVVSNIRNNRRNFMCRFRAATIEQASHQHHASFRQNRQAHRTFSRASSARGLQCAPIAYCSRRACSEADVEQCRSQFRCCAVEVFDRKCSVLEVFVARSVGLPRNEIEMSDGSVKSGSVP